MTADMHSGAIPQWTLADRLRKAREVTGMDQFQFADEIGVSRNTIGNYEAGRTKPRVIVLRAWSLRTGVPLQWLETGTPPPEPPCPRSDSNGRPTRYKTAHNRRSVATGRADRRLMIAA